MSPVDFQLTHFERLIESDSCDWPDCHTEPYGHSTWWSPCDCQPWGWYAMCGAHYKEAVNNHGERGYSQCRLCKKHPLALISWTPIR